MGELLFDEVADDIVDAAELTEPWLGSERFRRFGELLLTAEFPYKRGDFELRPAAEFDRDRCIAVCSKAVVAMAQEAGEPMPLGTRALKRLYIMGLGPTLTSYYEWGDRFSSLVDLRKASGSPEGFQRGKFSSWTADRYQAEAAKIELAVGGKPSAEDYRAAAEAGHFPGLKIIERKMGGVGAINELLGYPDVNSMDEDDYIELGRHVWEINGADKFKVDTFDILAGRDRGPTFRNIFARFGSIRNFREVVKRRVEGREQRLQLYRSQIRDIHPDWYANLSDDDLLQRCSRLELINVIAPKLHWREVVRYTDFPRADNFARGLSAVASRQYSHITPEYVVDEAKQLGLHGYIWPKPAHYKEHIQVTDDELSQRRAEKTRKHKLFMLQQLRKESA